MVRVKRSARYSWLVFPSVNAEDVLVLRILRYAAFRSVTVTGARSGVACCWMTSCRTASTAAEDALRNSCRVSSRSKKNQDAVLRFSLTMVGCVR